MDALFFNSITKSIEVPSNNIVEPQYNTKIKGLHISKLLPDGFTKVADIDNSRSHPCRWYFKNIDIATMYSDHTSWVYVITVDNIIVKIGETGNQLGHRNKSYQVQPSPSTKGRLSRYISGDGTDQSIRESMNSFITSGSTISFWAKKCNVIQNTEIIMGEPVLTESSTHKSQEVAYLDEFKVSVGVYPYLNKSRK